MNDHRRVHPKAGVESSPATTAANQQPIMQQPQQQRMQQADLQRVTAASGGAPVTRNAGLAAAAVITEATNSTTTTRSFCMPITNAHEFAPHPSIRCLSDCDTLLVQEDYASPFSAFSRENRYKVHNRNGRLLFLATEESAGCLLKQVRPFQIHVMDVKGDEVILLSKDCSCGIIHCANEVKVFSPPDNLIGTVSEGCGFLHPTYYLIDATSPEVPMFEITGPVCTCSCFCDDVDFPVFEKGKRPDAKVGFISKKWGGLVREVFTASDAFGVTFPIHFDPKYKVLFLAACFLIVSPASFFCAMLVCSIFSVCPLPLR